MKVFRLALLCPLLAAICWAQARAPGNKPSTTTSRRHSARRRHQQRWQSHAGPGVQRARHHAFHLSVGHCFRQPRQRYAAAGSPARVYKLTPDGKARIVFAPQSCKCRRWWSITIPEPSTPPLSRGKVYKIVHGGPSPGKTPEGHTTAEVAAAQEGANLGSTGENPASSVAVDSSYSASVVFDPKRKYIWALALDRQGQLYIGTGDRGEIFRVDRNGNGNLFFKSDEAQIRTLAFDNQGNLIAGTDGSGLIYRISPKVRASCCTAHQERNHGPGRGSRGKYLRCRSGREARCSAASGRIPVPTVGTVVTAPPITIGPQTGSSSSSAATSSSTFPPVTSLMVEGEG